MSKVLGALSGALPDERPLLSIQIVESIAKCPAGYVAVSRTYDEDGDAALLRMNGLFGKKPSHYICLSKTEGVPGYVMDGLAVVGEREPTPSGYSVAGRAGKRRLCTRVSRPAAGARAPVTDVIVCSRMRRAPQGFLLAGEINTKVICYKVSGGSEETSPTHKQNEYENIVSNVTPEANRSSISAKLYNDIKMLWNSSRLRAAPERPPKVSPLVAELNRLNVSPASPEFGTNHDYEALSPSYNIKPARPAPRPPPASPAPRGPAPLPRAALYATLAGCGALDGVPFQLHPRLRGLPAGDMAQFPVIKKRTRFDLDRDYSYNFNAERQT